MTEQTPSTQTKQTAGALDIRNIIGGLIGAYGVILLLMGLFGDKEYDKTGDVNANLWAGLAMVIFAAAFLIWAWVRPTVVPDHVESPDSDRPPGH
ncbi:MAG TPA: hypothetical protein PLZ93_14750 [Nocardioides sp.]|uniref:hypothetical protein n=1 Tax=uncultured Nocardioides sp. TaxID=198441 RepID=UPI000ED0DA00|nr:hypothetical protein [uncultured Nocardioides sp.]HCB03526.1 hypothetical protein [Nocardioides sp.]HRI96873.1 hypothetical protein [Nocardioides sp.]HRK46641.1 hypothetical protein [Nocardioides sp.]